jgi:hypothetical protein
MHKTLKEASSSGGICTQCGQNFNEILEHLVKEHPPSGKGKKVADVGVVGDELGAKRARVWSESSEEGREKRLRLSVSDADGESVGFDGGLDELDSEPNQVMDELDSEPHQVMDELDSEPTQVPSMLRNDKVLQRIGCVFHTLLQVVICNECKSGVLGTHLEMHVKNHAKAIEDASGRLVSRQLTRALASATSEVRTVYSPVDKVDIPMGIQQSVEGIAEKHGFCCSKCGYCCSTDLSMGRHESQCGGKRRACLVQTIFKGAHRKYFPVLGGNDADGTQEVLHMLDEAKQLLEMPAATAANGREVSTFHRTLGWSQHISGYDSESLYYLVTAPDPESDTEVRLGEVVIEYLRNIKVHILETNPLVRRWVASHSG